MIHSGGNSEPNITRLGKTNKSQGEINKMLSLLCLLNVYKMSTAVSKTTEMKRSIGAVERNGNQ